MAFVVTHLLELLFCYLEVDPITLIVVSCFAGLVGMMSVGLSCLYGCFFFSE